MQVELKDAIEQNAQHKKLMQGNFFIRKTYYLLMRVCVCIELLLEENRTRDLLNRQIVNENNCKYVENTMEEAAEKIKAMGTESYEEEVIYFI